jgi:hypothetical protein
MKSHADCLHVMRLHTRRCVDSSNEAHFSTVSACWGHTADCVGSSSVFGQFDHSRPWIWLCSVSMATGCTARTASQCHVAGLRDSDPLSVTWQQQYRVINDWPLSRLCAYPGNAVEWQHRRCAGLRNGGGTGSYCLCWQTSWTNCVHIGVGANRSVYCNRVKINEWPDLFHV